MVAARKWRADRLGQLGSPIFAELAEWKRAAAFAGSDVIDLGIGSPDRPPTPAVRQALSEAALQAGAYRYPGSHGTEAFRVKAAEWMAYRFGVSLDPDAELVTLMGSQDGLAHLAMALCNPGDTALLPDPGYPIYAGSLALAGVEPVLMPLRAENGYLPDLDGICDDVWERAAFIVLNYPNNPLSAVADLDFYERVLHKAKQHQVLIVHDLAYSEMAFDGFEPPSLLAIPGAIDYAVEFHSLSKSFNMAGCRIGFLGGNRDAVGALRELKGHIDYGVFLPVQEAGIAALDEAMSGTLPKAGELYEQRRNRLIGALRQEGWSMALPNATMFAWAALPELAADGGGAWTSRRFAQELLQQAGVAVVPGEAFGREGEGFVRIALVEEEARLLEAAQRIGAFIRSRR
ncbi:aminotransferase class I/II-fold pyridoxal phosphate-dependent enzyme [Paenibacillus protaetiae]|uniref:Aminotransferase n=1 Tax=Paenibacillus protaetiae TaxID=2509456 RepID=A0A4P6EUH8_9BACL|nr:aminotransferase class I/II-fold pyridoxal phosphate-dependent enzyme [Paenibacillus protaetiae]QAY66622.1 aminotransferase class I/II-fold pyridoxal phosphate-dependent enzyme [Paenibacillus protaetiae]